MHPRLAEYARFVDLNQGDELERRASEGGTAKTGGGKVGVEELFAGGGVERAPPETAAT